MSKAETKAERQDARILARLRKFEQVAEDARAAESWTAVVSALTKAKEMESELARVAVARELAATSDVLVRLEKAAELALSDGSYGAAASFMEQAEEVRAKRAAEEAARREREAAAADPGKLKARLVAALRNLPAVLRDEVVDEAQAAEVH